MTAADAMKRIGPAVAQALNRPNGTVDLASTLRRNGWSGDAHMVDRAAALTFLGAETERLAELAQGEDPDERRKAASDLEGLVLQVERDGIDGAHMRKVGPR